MLTKHSSFPPILFSWLIPRLRQPTSVLSQAALITAVVACGMIGGKPSTSAPGGIDDPAEMQQACAERQTAIDEWERDKLRGLDDDFFEGRKEFFEAEGEQKRVIEEAEAMRWDLGLDCTKKSYELSQSGGDSNSSNGSDGDKRSSSGCSDCLSVRQLAEEYEANSFSAQQRYVGTRHTFQGTVESVDQEPSIPPKPVIRVRSDGGTISLRFDWGEDYSWVMALSKGDPVRASCKIRNLGTRFGSSSNAVIPSLDECVEAD